MMKILSSLVLASVWSGHPVGFDLLTHGDSQFVAFYDAQRRMTVASRRLGEESWTFFRPEGRWLERRQRRSSQVEWDSHNSLTMVIDGRDQIHLCGNMHADPLIYFRTARPLDITSFERVDRMVGSQEERCTYPRFMRGPNGALIFRYRDGSSGNGVDYYNVYDPETQAWKRLIDAPLLDGQGLMNAYARMPEPGPDGMYHMVWMWRDTPDCATNHDISYARSRNLADWENAQGKPLDLPITIECPVVVDPVPAGGGIINMCQSLGFDSQNRPIVSYHKHDENGNTQAYSARLEDGRWRIYQVSDWDYRWEFSGGGSVGAEIRVGGVQVADDGGLSQHYWHAKKGSGIWRLDEETLKPVGIYPPPPRALPEELMKSTSEFPGMRVRTMGSRGKGSEPGVRYILRWETLGPNRDRPRQQAPPPSELRLYTVAD